MTTRSLHEESDVRSGLRGMLGIDQKSETMCNVRSDTLRLSHHAIFVLHAYRYV